MPTLTIDEPLKVIFVFLIHKLVWRIILYPQEILKENLSNTETVIYFFPFNVEIFYRKLL